MFNSQNPKLKLSCCSCRVDVFVPEEYFHLPSCPKTHVFPRPRQPYAKMQEVGVTVTFCHHPLSSSSFVIHYVMEEKSLPNGRVAFTSERQGHKYLALVSYSLVSALSIWCKHFSSVRVGKFNVCFYCGAVMAARGKTWCGDYRGEHIWEPTSTKRN